MNNNLDKIKIHNISLVGYEVSDCQIISGGDKIKLNISIESDILIDNICGDFSRYSSLGKVPLDFKGKKGKISFFEKILNVEYLNENGLEVSRNDLNSAIKIILKIDNIEKEYFSNTIGNADFDTFYSKDHHLGVYNTFNLGKEKNLEKLKELSLENKYPNDIIFINRFYGNNYFLNIDGLTLKEINKEIIKKIKLGLDYVIITNNNLKDKNKIQKIIKNIFGFNKYIKLYFYNFPFCYLEKFENHIFYDAIYKRKKGYIFKKKCERCKYIDLCNGFRV